MAKSECSSHSVYVLFVLTDCIRPVFSSAESNDPEFDDYNRRFTALEGATEKLIKDTKAFTEAVTNLFTTATDFGTHFATLFHPFGSEYGLESKHPEAEHTIANVDGYGASMEEMKASCVPELELIESRIVGPIKEFQGILKAIRKSITKREHKVRVDPLPWLAGQVFAPSLPDALRISHLLVACGLDEPNRLVSSVPTLIRQDGACTLSLEELVAPRPPHGRAISFAGLCFVFLLRCLSVQVYQ